MTKAIDRSYVSHQAAVISGTRIRVATIQHFIEAGYSTSDILKEYPSLTEADISYRTMFGETPSATLQRTPDDRFIRLNRPSSLANSEFA